MKEVELIHNHDADCPGCDATITRLTGELAAVKHTASIMAKEANRDSDYVFSLLAQSTAERDALRASLAEMTAKRDEVADEMIRSRNECHALRASLEAARHTIARWRDDVAEAPDETIYKRVNVAKWLNATLAILSAPTDKGAGQ